MNIAQNVERSRYLFPDKPALLFEGKSFTYQELDELTNRIANGLKELGIEQGNRIALFLPNIPEFVISYLGIQKIGAIAVSVNVSLKSDEVKFILDDSEPVVLITTKTLLEKVQRQDLPYLKHILIAEGKANTDVQLSDLMANASANARAVEMEPDAPAAILYTSGTMGFPKGATLSHANIVSNMSAANQICGMRPDDRILLFVPLFHCFGQNAILNSSLNAGATIVLHRTSEPTQILKSVVGDRISMFFGVPTTFILLYDHAVIEQMQSVRYYFSAAATLPVEIAKKWQEKFSIPIHQGYGLTETSPFASYSHSPKYKLGSIGKPIENVEIKIINQDSDREAVPGELGEIVIRGSNVMLGYWNRPVETANAIRNGWFHTGDIGKMDEEGYFYIVDRLKDMINVGGLKVYPAEVENVIYQHSSVAEVAVFGVLDALMGEQVRAQIVLKPGHEATAEEIITFCQQRSANFKVPSTVEFVDSIPKNPTGKVLKRLLASSSNNKYPLRNLDLAVPNNISLSREVILAAEPEERQGLLHSYLSQPIAIRLGLTASSIDVQQPLNNMGLDSLMASDLKNRIEVDLGVSVSIINLLEGESIANLSAQIIEQLTTENAVPSAQLVGAGFASKDWEQGVI